MDYSKVRFKAVVDWVEFEVCTIRPTQARHVYDKLNDSTVSVTGCDLQGIPFPKGISNTTTTKYRIKIQSPKCADSLRAMLNYVLAKLSLEGNARFTGLEVAFDTYLPNSNKRDLAEIATDLYRFSTNVPEQDWNLYRCEGEGRHYVNTLGHRRDLVARLEEGWQLTDASSKAVDTRYHIYVKTTDNGGKSLPPNQHRARFEVTLQGAALPCTMEELFRFDFAKLAKHFKFRRLSDRPERLHPAARHVLSTWSTAQLGRRGSYPGHSRNVVGRFSKGQSSIFRRSTEADDHLSRLGAWENLRNLTQRWRWVLRH